LSKETGKGHANNGEYHDQALSAYLGALHLGAYLGKAGVLPARDAVLVRLVSNAFRF